MGNYKLLLVDDEEEVRRGVLKKINWNEYGFDIVGEAENGKEALDSIERTLPDVVITDIKMPFMDGLELTKVVREKYPTIKFIVLTGFDEFEYAQKAIKLNVMEYVLKPISANELIDILIKVKSQIDSEIAEKKNVEILKEYYIKSIPVLKDKFLTSLVTTTLEKEEIREKSETYNIDLSGKGFVVSIVSIDGIIVKSKIDLEKNSNIVHKGLQNEKELLKFAVLNIVEEIVLKHNLGTVFLSNEHVVIVSVYKKCGSENVIPNTIPVLEEIQQAVEKYLKFTVAIGVGNVCSDIIHLSRSYQSALAALDYRFLMVDNSIIIIEDIEPERNHSIVFDEIKEHTLSSSIKVGSRKDISDTVDKLFNEIIDSKTSFKDYQVYLMEMLTTVLKTARNANVDIDNVIGINRSFLTEFYSLGGLAEVKAWFMDISVKIMEHIAKERQDTSKHIVENAKKYVKDHFHESDVTINGVCDYLHISPTYFSFIFKRETKITFINYLTNVRMDAAKELLRNTGMKAFEIAEKVGYSEPNYFSYSFKKKFGMSPSEYRNSAK
jgi:two-component system, response regulator YesN